MSQPVTTYDVSHEVLLSRVEALLEEWGACQRREPGSWVSGLPGESVESRLARDYGRRSKSDQRRRWAHVRKRRRIDMGNGLTVSELPMVTDRSDRQTKVMKRPTPQAWPEHVQVIERLLAQMPDPMRRVVCTYFIGGCSIRSGADILKLSKATYSARLDAARWYIAGQISMVDSSLSGQ